MWRNACSLRLTCILWLAACLLGIDDDGALRMADARRSDFDDENGNHGSSTSSAGPLDGGRDSESRRQERLTVDERVDGRELVCRQSADRKAVITKRHRPLELDLWTILRDIPQLVLSGEFFRSLLPRTNNLGDRHRSKRSNAVVSPTDVLFRQKAVSRPSSASSSPLPLQTQRGDENVIRSPETDGGDSSDPHAGMVLTLVNSRRHETVSYELLEIMHLELGERAVHVNDYAYTPVLSDRDAKDDDGGEIDDRDSHLIGPRGSKDEGDSVAIESTGSSVCHVPSEEGDDETRSLSLTREEPIHNDLEESSHPGNAWWQWWIPKRKFRSYPRCNSEYQMNQGAFAGGSHGQVWRGRRRCDEDEDGADRDIPPQDPSDRDGAGIDCREPLVLKRLKVDAGYRMLEAGLREVHFGRWLASLEERHSRLFTRYVDHFFREDRRVGEALDLWIVFEDAGPSLRSYLYTGIIVGDLVLYQQSALWTKMRLSVAGKSARDRDSSSGSSLAIISSVETLSRAGEARPSPNAESRGSSPTFIGREVMRSVLRQILEAAAFLHGKGIVHRDIKPSNVMCSSNITIESILREDDTLFRHETNDGFPVHCVLGDFSSAWSLPIDRNLYTRGPSRLEQTDEYAPPEAIFGSVYNQSTLSPAFDSWSIGILALEMLLGSPNVFTVDQRTRAVLTQKLKKDGATEKEIQRALYLAALSQFCIYSPSKESHQNWTHHVESSIHRLSMVKASCTLHDFHRALRVRDPLGLGFDESADTLLHLIWQLLAWDPDERMLPAAALQHSYFAQHIPGVESDDKHMKALESQMLDPRMDFNLSAAVDHFVCPKCGRSFEEWNSCLLHVTSRRHARFCHYDRSALPSCLSSHAMLPAHPHSGYCDIQGRRRTIEDFHAIRLLPAKQYYGIFDGHTGNLASKYVASFLFDKLDGRLSPFLNATRQDAVWKETVRDLVTAVFDEIHREFLAATSLVPHAYMDQSGTTATTAFVTSSSIVIASLGDSRSIISHYDDAGQLTATQLTKDHVASDPREKALVEARGGRVVDVNGISRVEGLLVITRSIGDANISPYLSREPHVVVLTREETHQICGSSTRSKTPCFLVLASDGLWDTLSNQDAVEMVSEVLQQACGTGCSAWNETTGMQQAAEALTHEAYVRGSKDNIGVVVVAVD